MLAKNKIKSIESPISIDFLLSKKQEWISKPRYALTITCVFRQLLLFGLYFFNFMAVIDDALTVKVK
jgi:hypothetical protein